MNNIGAFIAALTTVAIASFAIMVISVCLWVIGWVFGVVFTFGDLLVTLIIILAVIILSNWGGNNNESDN